MSWQEVAADLPGVELEIVAEVDSTNSELMRRARNKLLAPTLLVALRQTAGRGRLGRTWQTASQEGSALTFSLGLPLDRTDLSGLSLAVGVSVAQSLHPALRLKWPNDVWLNDRKLAGILIETATFHQSRCVVIGVGVNLDPPNAQDLATPAASLRELRPEMDAPATLRCLAKPLLETLYGFSTHGFLAFRDDFQRLDGLAGRAVMLSDGLQGIACGVNERGALLVHTSTGEQVIESSQLSVRPVN